MYGYTSYLLACLYIPPPCVHPDLNDVLTLRTSTPNADLEAMLIGSKSVEYPGRLEK